MEEEIWKDIKDYEGLYQVSNMGRVKSLERIRRNGKNTYQVQKEKILNGSPDKDGYLRVFLSKQKENKGYKVTTYKIHRLVIEAFIENINNLPQVNHKDEDITNNRLDNLEYCDAKYNCNYGNHNKKLRLAWVRRKGVVQPYGKENC